MTDKDEAALMGPWMTVALVVGGMIGAGIFLVPVSLAPLGVNAVAGWIVSGFGALALAFTMARLARQDGCGIQAYIERSLGSTVGFLVTWAFWVSVWSANAALAIATSSALSRIFPQLSSSTAIALFAIFIIAVLVAINAMGARATGRTAVITTLLKILPLIAAIAVFGQRQVIGEPLAPFAPMPLSFDMVATAATLTLFALTGFETATAPVGKVRNPARNIPLAIVAGTAFVALLYLAASTAVALVVPYNEVAVSAAPFADAIATEWGEGAAWLVAAGMAISAFGCLNGGVMVAGELGFSMGLRGDLPRWMTATSRHKAPVVSQLFAAALTTILVLANISKTTAALFTFVILLATSATLWLYLASVFAVLKGRPGLPTTLAAIIGLLFIAFAFYGAGPEANFWSIALLAAGLAVRTLMRRKDGSTPPREARPAAPVE